MYLATIYYLSLTTKKDSNWCQVTQNTFQCITPPPPPTPPTTQCNKRPQDCNLVLVQPTHTMCSKMNPQSFPMSSANTFLSLPNRTRLFKKQSGCREDLGNCCGNYFVTITKLPICAQLKHC